MSKLTSLDDVSYTLSESEENKLLALYSTESLFLDPYIGLDLHKIRHKYFKNDNSSISNESSKVSSIVATDLSTEHLLDEIIENTEQFTTNIGQIDKNLSFSGDHSPLSLELLSKELHEVNESVINFINKDLNKPINCSKTNSSNLYCSIYTPELLKKEEAVHNFNDSQYLDSSELNDTTLSNSFSIHTDTSNSITLNSPGKEKSSNLVVDNENYWDEIINEIKIKTPPYLDEIINNCNQNMEKSESNKNSKSSSNTSHISVVSNHSVIDIEPSDINTENSDKSLVLLDKQIERKLIIIERMKYERMEMFHHDQFSKELIICRSYYLNSIEKEIISLIKQENFNRTTIGKEYHLQSIDITYIEQKSKESILAYLKIQFLNGQIDSQQRIVKLESKIREKWDLILISTHLYMHQIHCFYVKYYMKLIHSYKNERDQIEKYLNHIKQIIFIKSLSASFMSNSNIKNSIFIYSNDENTCENYAYQKKFCTYSFYVIDIINVLSEYYNHIHSNFNKPLDLNGLSPQMNLSSNQIISLQPLWCKILTYKDNFMKYDGSLFTNAKNAYLYKYCRSLNLNSENLKSFDFDTVIDATQITNMTSESTKQDIKIINKYINTIDLSNNEISTFLWDHNWSYPNLKELVLSDNLLIKLCNSRALTSENKLSLYSLDVSINRINEINMGDSLPYLENFQLSSNRLSTLEGFRCRYLQILTAQRNLLTSPVIHDSQLFNIFPILQEFDGSGNLISSYKEFKFLLLLEKLYLTDNQIVSTIKIEGVNVLERNNFLFLTILVLSENKLTHFPHDIVAPNLHLLNLEYNSIKNLLLPHMKDEILAIMNNSSIQGSLKRDKVRRKLKGLYTERLPQLSCLYIAFNSITEELELEFLCLFDYLNFITINDNPVEKSIVDSFTSHIYNNQTKHISKSVNISTLAWIHKLLHVNLEIKHINHYNILELDSHYIYNIIYNFNFNKCSQLNLLSMKDMTALLPAYSISNLIKEVYLHHIYSISFDILLSLHKYELYRFYYNTETKLLFNNKIKNITNASLIKFNLYDMNMQLKRINAKHCDEHKKYNASQSVMLKDVENIGTSKKYNAKSLAALLSKPNFLKGFNPIYFKQTLREDKLRYMYKYKSYITQSNPELVNSHSGTAIRSDLGRDLHFQSNDEYFLKEKHYKEAKAKEIIIRFLRRIYTAIYHGKLAQLKLKKMDILRMESVLLLQKIGRASNYKQRLCKIYCMNLEHTKVNEFDTSWIMNCENQLKNSTDHASQLFNAIIETLQANHVEPTLPFVDKGLDMKLTNTKSEHNASQHIVKEFSNSVNQVLNTNTENKTPIVQGDTPSENWSESILKRIQSNKKFKINSNIKSMYKK